MDENNNSRQPPEEMPPKKENPFKNKKFYIAYFAAVLFLFAVSWIFGGFYGWMFVAMIFGIPYAILGTIVWAVMWATAPHRSRALALGIFLGCITPFIVIFIVTGGCGLLFTF
ncbi:MAG: DUF4407 domain-containing protein [Oscillospiraceae bacterium]|nr:DUF4407 domain-containing protein [Oscillospiraceae bacterium]